mgnify:CR=1 FL=1
MDKLDTKEIPEKPGIYIFKDKFEEPLYVGKAKNLRKRVPSYFGQGTSCLLYTSPSPRDCT